MRTIKFFKAVYNGALTVISFVCEHAAFALNFVSVTAKSLKVGE